MRLKMTKVIIGMVFILLIGALTSDYDTAYSSRANMRAINSHSLVIGEDFFQDGAVFGRTLGDLGERLQIVNTLESVFGIKTPIHLGINSLGGLLGLYDALDEYGQGLLQAHVVCTISAAASMAFTFIIKYCDERIMLPEAVVMTHRAYIPLWFSKLFTDATERATLKYSDEEAAILGQDPDFWYKLTRENGDKEFTVEEMKKYKIATGFVKGK